MTSFAGEPFEGTSMLAYHRARWMDARVGRFEGMDPEDGLPLHPLSLHRYIYAGLNPVDNTDSTGREYDMATIGAAASAGAALSTLATVSFAQIAADVVCQAAEYSGTPMDPSRCPTIQHFFHYEDANTRDLVQASGTILSPTLQLVFVTNEIYTSGAEAQNSLALPRTPIGYWDIPSSNIDYLVFAGPALEKNLGRWDLATWRRE